jgi:hypothetical protein
VVEATDQACDHGDPGAADASEQCPDLGDADRCGFFEVEGVEATTDLGVAAVRKIAAASGLANKVRRVCSSARPVIPAGMVATMSSQAIRSSGVVSRRVRRVWKKPPMIRIQSARK